MSLILRRVGRLGETPGRSSRLAQTAYNFRFRRGSVFPGLGVTFVSIVFRLLPRGVMRWLVERRFQRSRAAGSAA